MTLFQALFMIALFQFKHMLADFYWQSGWMAANKGRYGHPAGLAHAGIHVAASLPILLFAGVDLPLLSMLLAGELVFHYHVDWAKDQLIKRAALLPTESGFWNLTGLDQFLHHMTYVVIVTIIALATVT